VPVTPGTGTQPPGNLTAAELLDRSLAEFAAAQEALRAGDLAEYARHVEAAQADAAAARTKLQAAATTTTVAPSSAP
jgi:arginase family enzyme